MTRETIAAAEGRLLDYARRMPPGAYRETDTTRAQYNELFSAHLLHALGADRDAVTGIVRGLARTQEADGFLPASESVAGSAHDATYLRLHKSALFFQLAHEYAVDVAPPDLARVMPLDRLEGLLASLDWRNIWLHSNVLLGVATAADFLRARGRALPHLETMAGVLASTQDASGLWGETRGASRLNAMAGSFHLVPILQAAGRPVPRADAMRDTVLSLQTPRGFFCGPTGYSCIEYDAAYLLHAAGPADRARAAGQRLAAAMLAIQQPDGGFPEMGRPSGVAAAVADAVVPVMRHRDPATLLWNLKKIARVYVDGRRPFLNNSVAECAALPHESNVFSSWFRFLTLRLAADLAGIVPFDRARACGLAGLNYRGGA